MIRAVIFDLDDTLYLECDYMRSGYRYIAGILAKQYSIDFTLAYKRMCAFSDQGKPVFDSVLASFGVPFDVETISSLIKAYRDHTPTIRFCPDTLPAIASLRQTKLRLGILTGGHVQTQHKKLRALGAQVLFDRILITGEYTGAQKPSPTLFAVAAVQLGGEAGGNCLCRRQPAKGFLCPSGLSRHHRANPA